MFFDLVFVFGFTQVTTVLSRNPTWSGLGHGLLILATLWWAWAAYAWLTNTVDPDVGAVWGAMLVAMGAMFVAASADGDSCLGVEFRRRNRQQPSQRGSPHLPPTSLSASAGRSSGPSAALHLARLSRALVSRARLDQAFGPGYGER